MMKRGPTKLDNDGETTYNKMHAILKSTMGKKDQKRKGIETSQWLGKLLNSEEEEVTTQTFRVSLLINVNY